MKNHKNKQTMISWLRQLGWGMLSYEQKKAHIMLYHVQLHWFILLRVENTKMLLEWQNVMQLHRFFECAHAPYHHSQNSMGVHVL